MKDVQDTGEDKPSKTTIQHYKHEISSLLFLCVIFALLDPDPVLDPADQNQRGRDPQHCWELYRNNFELFYADLLLAWEDDLAYNSSQVIHR